MVGSSVKKQKKSGVASKKAQLKSALDEIHRLESELHSNNKKLNNLLPIFEYLRSERDEIKFAAIRSLCRLFEERAELLFAVHKSEEPTKKRTKSNEANKSAQLAAEQIRQWLRTHFDRYLSELFGLFDEKEIQFHVTAIDCCFRLIGAVSPFTADQTPPNQLLQRLVERIYTRYPFIYHEAVLKCIRENYLDKYDDLRYFFLRTLKNCLEQPLGSNVTHEAAVENAMSLLLRLPVADTPTEFLWLKSSVVDREEESEEPVALGTKRQRSTAGTQSMPSTAVSGAVAKALNGTEHRRAIGACWTALLKLRLPRGCFKRFLIALPRHILPVLQRPEIILMDTLSDSCDAGGLIGVLALNSLFVMITKYNLDYPNFYQRLYSFLQPDLLLAKYRRHFFKLLDLVLRSTHLPDALVAAFIKRLMRLALLAPPTVCLVAMALAANLFIRHPSTARLINRTALSSATSDGPLLLNAAFGVDPFKADEPDPLKCEANNSSLWELTAMKQHMDPAVARMARIFDSSLNQRVPFDLDIFLPQTYQTRFDAQINRKQKGVTPVAFEPPTSLFSAATTLMWDL